MSVRPARAHSRFLPRSTLGLHLSSVSRNRSAYFLQVHHKARLRLSAIPRRASHPFRSSPSSCRALPAMCRPIRPLQLSHVGLYSTPPPRLPWALPLPYMGARILCTGRAFPCRASAPRRPRAVSTAQRRHHRLLHAPRTVTDFSGRVHAQESAPLSRPDESLLHTWCRVHPGRGFYHAHARVVWCVIPREAEIRARVTAPACRVSSGSRGDLPLPLSRVDLPQLGRQRAGRAGGVE